MTRRDALKVMAAGAGVISTAPGCSTSARADAGKADLIWGDQGSRPGHLQRPRAISVDDQDRLYLADLTDRIQVFSTDGEFISHWQLPAFDADGPTGLSIGRDGNLIVGDTHFFRILTYTPDGELVNTLGGTPGAGVGEFGMVRDAIEDSDGVRACRVRR